MKDKRFKGKNFPFDEENENFVAFQDLLNDKCYKKFRKSNKYKPVPFLHLAYFFEKTRIRLGGSDLEGNFI